MPSSSRASHYQRFIPKEEVQEVETVLFGAIDDPLGLKAKAKAAEAAPMLDAQQAQALRMQAWDEGYEAGLLAGAERTRTELQQQTLQVQREIGRAHV